MFIDTHAHLTDPALLPDLADILSRARESGVHKVVVICSSLDALQAALTLKEKDLYLAAALPPHDALNPDEAFFQALTHAAESKRLVAIGETGLDYFHKDSPKKEQETLLLRHLELAKRLRLPLLFHCRDAFQDLFAFTDESRCLLHCFTGTLADMKEAVRRNWLISFSGIVTYKNAGALRDIASATPIENIVIETDAPYLSPQSKRGSRNEPAHIVETAKLIAELKGISFEEFGAITSENCERLFHFRGRS